MVGGTAHGADRQFSRWIPVDVRLARSLWRDHLLHAHGVHAYALYSSASPARRLAAKCQHLLETKLDRTSQLHFIGKESYHSRHRCNVCAGDRGLEAELGGDPCPWPFRPAADHARDAPEPAFRKPLRLEHERWHGLGSGASARP